ncbi:hypothetical protein RhiLY_02433 [Ceratobasidium sp. AG-Ba]|nr:hypothetical protein RhiLY_02433 [Ceratobasidium sp. AG-Ba]
MIARLRTSDPITATSGKALWSVRVSHPLRQWTSLRKRVLAAQDADPAARKLVIVGIVFGILSILILVGLVVYVSLRYRSRRRHPHHRRSRTSVPATSRIRNGYSRARTESGATDGSHSARTPPTVEPKQGYFKSWSQSKKAAYLSVPNLNPSHHHLVLESSEAVYRYDPEAAIGLPKQKRKKSSRSPFAVLAPLPKVNVPSRPPLVEVSNVSLAPVRSRPDPLRAPNRAIRPRAELRMGQPSFNTRMHSLARTGGALGGAGLGSFVPPPPPSWASFWPTESGFTGYGGEPSIRDEEFGTDSDEEWASDNERVQEKLRAREEAELREQEGADVQIVLERKASVRSEYLVDEEGQYALDTRPAEQLYGQFRLTPRELQGVGRTSLEADPIAEGGSFTTGVSPLPSARLETKSPHLDLGESGESEPDELSRLADEPTDLRRGATGRFTIAFGAPSRSRSLSVKGSGSKSGRIGRSSSGRTRTSSLKSHSNCTGPDPGTDHSSGHNSVLPTSAHSRHPSGAVVARSNTGVTRSSTMRTDSSGASSGQILSAVSGRLATPLFRSVESLRRIIGTYTEPPEMDNASPVLTGSSPELENPPPPPYLNNVRRLPPIPSASPVPPVPPIPQHYLDSPPDAQPTNSTHTANEHGVLRSMSLPLIDDRALPSRPDNLPHAAVPRSVSLRATRPIRPLPVPPLPATVSGAALRDSRS